MTTPDRDDDHPAHGHPGRVVRLPIPHLAVQSLQVAGTDIVVQLRDGTEVVIPNGAVRAMIYPDFAVVFNDAVVSGASVLKQSDVAELNDSVRLTTRQDDASVDVVVGHEMADSPSTTFVPVEPGPSTLPAVSTEPGALIRLSSAMAAVASPAAPPAREGWAFMPAQLASDVADISQRPPLPWVNRHARVSDPGLTDTSQAIVINNAVPAAMPTVPSYVVSGTVWLGQVIHALTIQAYGQSGQLLWNGRTLANGAYEFRMTNGYAGPILIEVSGANAIDSDYVNEATGQASSLGQARLRSVAVADGLHDVVANVTPLTELAIRQVSVVGSQAPADTQRVIQAYDQIASDFGLPDSTLVTPVWPTVDSAGQPTLGYNSYGHVLAALAALSLRSGSTDLGIAQLNGVLQQQGSADGATVLSAALQTYAPPGLHILGNGQISLRQPQIPVEVEYDWMTVGDHIQVLDRSTGQPVGDAHTVTTSEAAAKTAVLALSAADLGQGSHVLYAQVTTETPAIHGDTLTNPIATLASVPVWVDTQPPIAPQLTASAPFENALLATSAEGAVKVSAESGSSVTATFSSADDTLVKSLQATGILQGVSLSQSDIAALGDGPVAVSVVATDAVGNMSATASTTFTLKNTADAVKYGGLDSSGIHGSDPALTNNARPVYDVVTNPNNIVLIAIDGVTYTASATGPAATAYQASVQSSLADGDYTPVLTVIDAAGNTSTVSGPSFTVKTAIHPTATGVLDAASDSGSASNDGLTRFATNLLYDVTAEAGDAVTVSVNGVTYTASATGAGAAGTAYQALVTATLADGTYTPFITVADAAGNTSTSNGSAFTVKTAIHPAATGVLDAASDSGTNSSDAITNLASQLPYDVTAEAGDAVTVSVNGVSYTASATGTVGTAYQALLTSALSDGTYTPSITVADSAGNISTSSGSTFTVKTAIRPTATGALDAASDSGSASNDGLTRFASNLRYDVTAEAGDAVTVSVNGVSYAATATGTAGTAYQALLTSALSDGTYTPSITVADAAGNTSTSNGSSFTVKTAIRPTATGALDAASDSGSASNDGLTRFASNLRYDVTAEAGDAVTVSVNGVSYTASATGTAGTAYQALLTATLADARYTPLITVADSAGNISTSSGSTFTVKTAIRPTATGALDAASDSGSASNDGLTRFASNLRYDVTAEAGDAVTVSVNGVSYTASATGTAGTAYQALLTATLADASYTPLITVADSAGNISTSSGSAFTVKTAIRPTATGALDAASDSGSASNDGLTRFASNLRYDVTAEAGDSVTVSVNGVSYAASATGTAGTAYQALLTATLADARYTPLITVADTAGNTSTSNGSAFTVKTAIRPTATGALDAASDSGSASNDGLTRFASNLRYDVTAEAGDAVTVSVNGVTYTATATGTAGTAYQALLTSALTDGTYNPSITVADAAGNISTSSGSTFTVKTAIRPTATGALDAASDSGSASNDGLTRFASNLRYDVTAEAGYAVTLSVNGVSYTATATGTAGTAYQALLTSTLPDGTYNPSITVADAAGNTSTSSGAAITVRAVAATPLTGLATNSQSGLSKTITTNTTPAYFINTGEPGDVVVATFSGQSYTLTGTQGVFTLTLQNINNGVTSALADGTYTPTYQLTDLAGNRLSGNGTSIVVENTPPTLTYGNTLSFQIYASTSAEQAGLKLLPSSINPSIVDSANTISSATIKFAINHLTALNDLTVKLGNASISLGGNGNASGSAKDGHVPLNWSYDISTQTLTLTPDAASASTANMQMLLSDLVIQTPAGSTAGQGSNSVTFTIINGAGLQATATESLFIGNSVAWLDAASDSGLSPVDQITRVRQNLIYDVAAPANSTVSVSLGGTAYSATPATAGSTAYQATILASLADGIYTPNVYVNGSSLSAGVGSFTVDTSPPQLSSGQRLSNSVITSLSSLTAPQGVQLIPALILNENSNVVSSATVTIHLPTPTTTGSRLLLGSAGAGLWSASGGDLTAMPTVSTPLNFSTAALSYSGSYDPVSGNYKVTFSQLQGTSYPSAVLRNLLSSLYLSSSNFAPGNAAAVSVIATDSAGNTTPFALADTLLVPAIPTAITTITGLSRDTGVSSSDFMTSVARQTVSGTWSGALGPSDLIQVSADGGTTWVTGSVTGAGTWSASDVQLLAGNASLQVRVSNPAGSMAGGSQSYSLVGAPNATATITSITDQVGSSGGSLGNSYTGALSSGMSTDDPRPLIVGQISSALNPGQVVVLNDGGKPLGTATVSGLGWSYTLNANLSPGPHVLTAQVSDPVSGATSTASAAMIINAGQALTATVAGISFMPQQQIISTSAFISPTGIVIGQGMISGITSLSQFSATGSSSAGGSIGYGYQYTPMTLNTSSPGLVKVWLATVAGTYVKAVEVTLSNDANGMIIARTTGVNYIASTTLSSFTPGYAQYMAPATSPTSGGYGVLGLQINNVAQFIPVPAGPTVLGGSIAAPLLAGEQITVYDGSSLLGTAVSSGTHWTLALPSGLSAGLHNISATLTFGSQTEISQSLTISALSSSAAAAPAQTTVISSVVDNVGGGGASGTTVGSYTGAISNGMSTDASQPVVSGTVSAALSTGQTVAIFDGTSLLGTATLAPGSTSWTYTPSGALGAGQHSLTAAVINYASGTQGPTSAPVTFNEQSLRYVAVNNVSPIAGTPVPVQLGTAPRLSGTLAAPLASTEALDVFSGNTFLGTATVKGVNWTYTPTTPVAGSSLTYILSLQSGSGAGSGTGTVLLTQSIPVAGILSRPPSQTVTLNVLDSTGTASPAGYSAGDFTGTLTSGMSTNATLPIISGTVSAALAPRQVVAIFDSGQLLGTASVSGTATAWSYTPGAAFGTGLHSISAAVVNTLSGASGAYSASVNLLEQVLSPVTVQANPQSAGQPLLSGTLAAPLDPAERMAIFNGASFLGTATVTGLNWTFTPPAALTGGSCILSAQLQSGTGALRGLGTVELAQSVSITLSAPSQLTTVATVFDSAGGGSAGASITGPVSGGISTDATQPIISGTISSPLAATQVVIVYDGTAALGTASLSAPGSTTWTYTPASALLPGAHVISACVTNAQTGAAGPLSNGVSFNEEAITALSASDATSTASGRLTTLSSTPLFSLTLASVLPGTEQLAIYDNGSYLGNATAVPASGTAYTFTPNAPLAAGVHAVVAQVESGTTGGAGLANGRADSTFILTVDPAAPVNQTASLQTIIDNTALNGSVTGTVASGASTDATQPLIRGVISAPLGPGQQVNIYDTLGTVTATLGTADVSGTFWRFTPAQSLGVGLHSLTAAVVDPYANLSGVASTPWTLNEQSIALTQMGNSANTSLTGSGLWASSISAPPLSGSLGAPLANGEQVVIYANGNALGTATVSGTSWSLIPPVALAMGSYAVSAHVESASTPGFSNALAASANAMLSVDVSVPAINTQITGFTDNTQAAPQLIPNTGTTDDPAGVLSGSISGLLQSPNLVVSIYDNGSLRGTAAVNGLNWTYTPTPAWTGGLHAITASVVNVASNAGTGSSGSFSFTEQPLTLNGVFQHQSALTGNVLAASGITLTDDAAVTLSGNLGTGLSGGQSVVIYDAGVRLGTASVSGTQWTLNTSGLTSGSHNIIAQLESSAAPGTPLVQTLPLALNVQPFDPVYAQVSNLGLSLPGLNQVLDMTGGRNSLTNVLIDEVNLSPATTNSGNILQLKASALSALSFKDAYTTAAGWVAGGGASLVNSTYQLAVDGPNGGTVQIDSTGWAQQSGNVTHAGVTYNSYVNGVAQLLIDNHLAVQRVL